MATNNQSADNVYAWQVSTHDSDENANHYVLCRECMGKFIGADECYPIHKDVVGRVLICHNCNTDLSNPDAQTNGTALARRDGPPACQRPECENTATGPSYTYCPECEREYSA